MPRPAGGHRRTAPAPPGVVVLLAAALAGLALSACGRGETATARVTRVRSGYRVQPNGFQTRRAADGSSELVMSVLVVNRGRESLPSLTLLVHVQSADGVDRVAVRTPLDTSRLVPGVSGQLSAVLRGVGVGPDERVLIELENEPPAEALPEFPEYRAAAPGGP